MRVEAGQANSATQAAAIGQSKVRSAKSLPAGILLVLMLFPYASPFRLPFDTQPTAMVFATLLVTGLLIRERGSFYLPNLSALHAVPLAYATLHLIHGGFSFDAARSMAAYWSVLVLSVAGYWFHRRVDPRIFVGAVAAWLLAGVAQATVSRDAMAWIVPRLSTSLDRGMTGFAPEPSYFGAMAIVFLVVNDLFRAQGDYGHGKYRFVLIAAIMQVALSASAMSVLLLLIYIGARLAVASGAPARVRSVFMAAVVAALGITLMRTGWVEDSRLGRLAARALADPSNFVYSDGSVSDRLTAIIVSHMSLRNNYALGHGFGTWAEVGPSLALSSGDFVLRLSAVHASYGRVMSGWGAAAYELGVVGLTYPAILLVLGVRILTNNSIPADLRSAASSGAVTVFFLMTTAVSLALPAYGYYVGVLIAISGGQDCAAGLQGARGRPA